MQRRKLCAYRCSGLINGVLQLLCGKHGVNICSAGLKTGLFYAQASKDTKKV